VLELIDQRFGIRPAVTTVGRYLHSWGFTPPAPQRKALERDPETVREWLAERYPRSARAKREGGIVVWQDETGVPARSSRPSC